MTARQPRRRRRLQAAAAPLPRPAAASADLLDEEEGAEGPAPVTNRRLPRRAANFGQRTHHVTNDYSYVHKDLITVGVVGVIVTGFILVMSLIV